MGKNRPKRFVETGVTPRRDAEGLTSVRWSRATGSQKTTPRRGAISAKSKIRSVLGIFCLKRVLLSAVVDNDFCKPTGLRPADAGQKVGASGRLRQYTHSVLGKNCLKRMPKAFSQRDWKSLFTLTSEF
ncbi:MAG: hypothetical protein MUD08_11385 [Cytophagales bacterium]|nr:hypothetical protein [Cytophagales bacterium]